MAKEIERKFLVRTSDWRAAAKHAAAISQFYVTAGEDRSVRVRIADGKKAKLTIKFGGAMRARDEFEYSIPLADARDMERFALGNVIRKRRYNVSHRGRIYEVDTFEGALTGLVIAELETPDEVPDEELPDWLGEEVTDDRAFYNLSLALEGAP